MSSNLFDNKELFGDTVGEVSSGAEGSKSAQYLIYCKDFFESSVETSDGEGGSEGGIPCLSIQTASARPVTYDSSGELDGDGKVSFRNAIVRMKYGVWGPKLQDAMFQGKKIENIAVCRLSQINGNNMAVQVFGFDSCVIKTYTQVRDIIIFSFAFAIYRDIKIVYDAEEATMQGIVGVQFDVGLAKRVVVVK
jgi:hypothetical protein